MKINEKMAYIPFINADGSFNPCPSLRRGKEWSDEEWHAICNYTGKIVGRVNEIDFPITGQELFKRIVYEVIDANKDELGIHSCLVNGYCVLLTIKAAGKTESGSEGKIINTTVTRRKTDPE